MATMAMDNEVLNVDVMAKSVCIALTLGSIGNTRQVSTSEITTDADKDRLSVSKRLFDCKEFKAIRTFHGEVRQYIYKKAHKSPFRAGMYLLPDALLEEVINHLTECADVTLPRLVEDFLDVYPREVERAREELKSLFDPRDFPPANILRAQFYMTWNLLEFKVPGKLSGMNRDIYNRELEKAEARAKEAAVEIQLALRAAAADLVAHLVDRLSGKDDGKKKVFRNSMLENVNEFLETFQARNLTNDEELAKLIQKAKKLTKGIDADTLRENENVREMVLEGFEKIKTELDTLTVEKTSRSILV